MVSDTGRSERTDMICLTGDIHQRSYRGTDTPYCNESEVTLALKYAQMAERYGLRVTLFLTGRTALEEPGAVHRLAKLPHCEIGGHTFAAFRDPRSRIYRKLWGTPWASPSHQARDIARTIESLQQAVDRPVTVWRNHSYLNAPETPMLLQQAGIKCVSDEVNPAKLCAERVEPGLVSLPINVLPDHEHLFHGKYVPGRAKPSQLSGRMGLGAWFERVQAQVQMVTAAGGVATILAHPLCMEVADGMHVFEDLCRFLRPFASCWVSAAAGGM